MIGATVLQFEGRDGHRLVGDRFGSPRHAPVLFLHGGGQTRRSWNETASGVAQRGWQALTLDARGHGESAWSERGDYRLESFAEDVRQVAARLDEPPVLVGASLGGLTSILLTGEVAPGIARGVVLVDIVPDMEQVGADRIVAFMVDRADVGFSSLDEVADSIAAYNPHRPRPTDLAGLRRNLRQRGDRFYWHWDPRFVAPEPGRAPVEIQDVDRLHAATGRMVDQGPVLLVRGRASDLVSRARAAAFCERFPAVEFVDVSGAGHMVAGDRNDAFTAAVIGFLERHWPAG